MAVENQDGQQVATPLTSAHMAEPANVTPAPAEPTPPQAPSGGRNLDELFNEMEELKRTNADLAEKAARAEHEAQYTRNLIDTFRQGGQPKQEEPTAGFDINDDEFLAAPGKTLSKALKSMYELTRQEREQREKEQFVERARNLFETGANTVLSKGNKLFAGIENDVKAQIRDGIINGVIDPGAAQDPDLWNMTAIAIRYKNRGERNFDKYFSNSPSPMSSQHTETPTAGAPPKAAPAMTDEDRQGAKFFGLTDEQWMAAKAKEGVK